MEYTYDNLSRVTKRKITNLSNNLVTEENYTYDANGNILSSAVNTDNDSFVYDANNRLTEYNGQAVTYDLDGNMLNANGMALTYDSANRLLSAGGNTYTYDVENTRVKNLCNGVETQYTYNTIAELSQLLVKTTGNTVTKYVYGSGLIGEETAGIFKTYHFDYRGSTVAITDTAGTVTDTFAYDSYGNVISRTGTTDAIFLYNGEYGVLTDTNGLLYMRARYYSPEFRRFVNADILMGDINNSTTLNRYAYVNGNPISNIDPFGLAADEGRGGNSISFGISPFDIPVLLADAVNGTELIIGNVKFVKDGKYINIKGDTSTLDKLGIKQRRIKASNVNKFNEINELINPKLFDTPSVILDVFAVGAETFYEINQYDSIEDKVIIGTYTAATGAISVTASAAASAGATAIATKIGASIGTGISPGIGTLIGVGAGLLVGLGVDFYFDFVRDKYIEDIVRYN